MYIYNTVVSFILVTWRLKGAYEGKFNGLVNADQVVSCLLIKELLHVLQL
jgi:hypothetical protein